MNPDFVLLHNPEDFGPVGAEKVSQYSAPEYWDGRCKEQLAILRLFAEGERGIAEQKMQDGGYSNPYTGAWGSAAIAAYLRGGQTTAELYAVQ